VHLRKNRTFLKNFFAQSKNLFFATIYQSPFDSNQVLNIALYTVDAISANWTQTWASFLILFLRKNTYIYPPKRGQVLEDI
jgi:hypothetical protein